MYVIYTNRKLQDIHSFHFMLTVIYAKTNYFSLDLCILHIYIYIYLYLYLYIIIDII